RFHDASPDPFVFSFIFTATATPAISTLSLHDALPILIHTPLAPTSNPPLTSLPNPSPSGTWPPAGCSFAIRRTTRASAAWSTKRSEEHTSELQSRENLVCRLLLEKKKKLKILRLRSLL